MFKKLWSDKQDKKTKFLEMKITMTKKNERSNYIYI